jgi:paraquat-inducible protein A
MPRASGHASALNHWRECTDCGLCSVIPHEAPGLVASCPRCGHVLWRMRPRPFQFSIACGFAAVFFYLVSVFAPFLEISLYGRAQLADINTGPLQLALQDYGPVALLVLAVSVIFPGVKLGIMLFTLLGVRGFWPPALLKAVFRWYRPITPWAMIDVYLLGFLVAYTRLTAIANVHLDTALFALIGLMLTMAAADAALDSESVWRALEQTSAGHGPALPEITGDTGNDPAAPVTGCGACGMVNPAQARHCGRCQARLHWRKPNAVSRAWALTAAAAFLYIPANIYPVMIITKLGKTQTFTIWGGIKELAAYGLWPLAALVFFASMMIPIFKLCSLAYLLSATQRASTLHLPGRTRVFRLVDFIGRWSMIDVFMVSILVALVRFGQFANIIADVGATCFAAVVVLTMFAVQCFDPRLMWDALEPAKV